MNGLVQVIIDHRTIWIQLYGGRICVLHLPWCTLPYKAYFKRIRTVFLRYGLDLEEAKGRHMDLERDVFLGKDQGLRVVTDHLFQVFEQSNENLVEQGQG